MRVRQWAFVFWFVVVFIVSAVAWVITGTQWFPALIIGTAIAFAVIIPALVRERRRAM